MSHPSPTLGPVKFIHTADWHIGRSIRGRSRHDEQAAVLAEIVDLAAAEAVDLVLIAGDQFDTAAPPPEAERLVYSTLLSLAEVAPVVMVAGNHDHPRRLEAVSPLLKLGRVTVGSSVARPEDGGVVSPIPDVKVALLPFLSQRSIVTADDLMALHADQHGGKYAERSGRIVEALCAGMTADTVNIVLSHLMVFGGETGAGERAAHTVFDYAVAAQIFPASLSYVALGHLHRHQRMAAAAPVWYSGSPMQLDFGEAGDHKGVVVVETEPGLPARVEFHRVRSARTLRTVTGTLAQVEAMAPDISDTEYVRVVLDEQARAGLADAVRRVIPQAVDVILDPRRRQTAPQRPTRRGRSHRELFTEYLRDQDAYDERVLALFDELVDQELTEGAHAT